VYGCQPAYTGVDRSQQAACFPDGIAIVYLAQQQAGMSEIKCWFPGMPNIDPPDAKQWQVCKGPKEGKGIWIDSQALKMEEVPNAKPSL
jgi:hypothetical protein